MKKTLSWIIAIPLLCSPLSAHGVDEENTPPARVVVGVKKCHKKTHNHHKKESRRTAEKSYSPLQASYSPFYYVKCVGVDGETLTTSDETVWQISPFSKRIALTWPQNSTVSITPSNFFSQYDYYLMNTATLETVNAKLSQGPFLDNAVFIAQINRYNNTIILSNGMGWQVVDSAPFATWQVGQAVLLGINTGWFGGSNLIINVNRNNYVTSNRLY